MYLQNMPLNQYQKTVNLFNEALKTKKVIIKVIFEFVKIMDY